MKKDIVIMGAGGFARELYSWIHETHNVIAFYSDNPQDQIMGIPVICDLSKHYGRDYVLAVGDPADKLKLSYKAEKVHGLTPCDPIIHKSAVIGVGNIICHGSIICPNSVITTNVKIYRHVIVNIGATIGHDCSISERSTVSPGANISGNVHIDWDCYIGTNASIREKLKIGRDSVIGMGSAVTKDVPMGEVWGGVPARKIK